MGNTFDGALKELENGGLERLAQSPEGLAAQRFAEKNEAALRAAASSGDENALKELLQGFMRTPEGSALSSALREMTKK